MLKISEDDVRAPIPQITEKLIDYDPYGEQNCEMFLFPIKFFYFQPYVHLNAQELCLMDLEIYKRNLVKKNRINK